MNARRPPDESVRRILNSDVVPAEILAAIIVERERQDARWGEQNHADVDPVLTGREGGCSVQRMAEECGVPTPNRARSHLHAAVAEGAPTWALILVEEVAEAIEAATLAAQGKGPEEAVDAELIQCAAVLVAWVEARVRRRVRAAAEARHA